MAFKMLQLARPVLSARLLASKTASPAPVFFSRDLVKTNLQDMWPTNEVHVQSSRTYMKQCADEKQLSSYWGQQVSEMVVYFDSDAMENNYATPERDLHADPYE